MTIIFFLIFYIVMLLTSIVKTQVLPQPQVLSAHAFSLQKRYPVASVSDVFKENILLNIAYLAGAVHNAQAINWTTINKPVHYALTLQPGQAFAFHDAVMSDYTGKIVKTTNAHFNSTEGFVSDGYLVGDGVCHLASLINWAARDAGLKVEAPTSHDFATIPGVPKKYGVAIYSNPDDKAASAMQNLYITNNKPMPVSIVFDYKNDTLHISIVEEKQQETEPVKIASLLFQ